MSLPPSAFVVEEASTSLSWSENAHVQKVIWPQPLELPLQKSLRFIITVPSSTIHIPK